MPTIKQLIRNTRQPIRNVTKSPALGGCPQRRGTCTRVYVRLVQIGGWDKRKETTFDYPWSVPMNRIKWKKPSLSKKKVKKKSSILILCIKFMVSLGANSITSILDFKTRKNSPLAVNCYPLSGDNHIKIKKQKKFWHHSCKNGRTKRVS